MGAPACVCIRVRVCVHVHVRVCLRVRVCVHVYVHVCLRVRVHVHIYMRVNACTPLHTYTAHTPNLLTRLSIKQDRTCDVQQLRQKRQRRLQLGRGHHPVRVVQEGIRRRWAPRPQPGEQPDCDVE